MNSICFAALCLLSECAGLGITRDVLVTIRQLDGMLEWQCLLGADIWPQTRPLDGSLPEPFRRMLRFNERLARSLFSELRLAARFPDTCVQPIRTNGLVGISSAYDPSEWQLNVNGVSGA